MALFKYKGNITGLVYIFNMIRNPTGNNLWIYGPKITAHPLPYQQSEPCWLLAWAMISASTLVCCSPLRWWKIWCSEVSTTWGKNAFSPETIVDTRLSSSSIYDAHWTLPWIWKRFCPVRQNPCDLNERCIFKILQDLECPKPVLQSLFSNSVRYLLPFGLGAAIKCFI